MIDRLIFSLVVMIGLEKCCITSAGLQWLCHSGERIVARGPLVFLPKDYMLRLALNDLPYNQFAYLSAYVYLYDRS